MSIPNNIKKEHLLQAILKINKEGIPPDGASRYYDLIFEGKRYPPKVVLSYANIFANGIELDRNSFSGGKGTSCFALLEKEGFTIVNKEKTGKIKLYDIHGLSAIENYKTLITPDVKYFYWDSKRFKNYSIGDIVFWVNRAAKIALFTVLDQLNIPTTFNNGKISINDNGYSVSATAENSNQFESFYRFKIVEKVNIPENWNYSNLVPFNGQTMAIILYEPKFNEPEKKISKIQDLKVLFESKQEIVDVLDETISMLNGGTASTEPSKPPELLNDNSSYFEELMKFLAQAETSNLKTSQYLKKYDDLNVKVSFGQANLSKIPWVAFLNQIDTVQKGIYPVYLYYKERRLLILAYGISETNEPDRSWNLSNGETIEQYFYKNNLGKPERYGNSFVYSTYDIQQDIAKEKIDKDLSNIIKIYKAMEVSSPSQENHEFTYSDFDRDALSAGLYFNEKIGLRFIASLLAKPFVILTGLSGSGKTKLAQAFALWICENSNQFKVIPVGADWTNREPLLGFPNALNENDYIKPDSKVLDLIIDANSNLSKPYFLILDEMNLSHVERYFADFLSVMESKGRIFLHSGEKNRNGVPSEIGLPKNLFIIGTVNIDETTYMFSPKVLDRANVIEFRVMPGEMEGYLRNRSILNLEKLTQLGSKMAIDFVKKANDQNMDAVDYDVLLVALMNFFSELKKAGAEFGYRSASEIIRFAATVNKLEPKTKSEEVIDAAIMQKLLPKVHGSRRKLEPILRMLGGLCLSNEQTLEDYLKDSNTSEAKYPVSLEKIGRMYNNLLSNGFTSYAEA